MKSSKIVLWFVFLFSIVACEDFAFNEVYEGKVVKVLDGDSINIIQQGKEVRIRLAEIDSPERDQPF
jgi:micrococcal nuclease